VRVGECRGSLGSEHIHHRFVDLVVRLFGELEIAGVHAAVTHRRTKEGPGEVRRGV